MFTVPRLPVCRERSFAVSVPGFKRAIPVTLALSVFTHPLTAETLPGAASFDPIRRPGQTESSSPAFVIPNGAPLLDLPPVRPRKPGPVPNSGLLILVRDIRVLGSSVFSNEQLAELTRSFTGRAITSDELRQLSNSITRMYIDRGYINSGAIIPDQDVVDGVIYLQVIEGGLSALKMHGLDRLRAEYISDRVWLAADTPLNVNDMQRSLRLLQEDPLVEQINAILVPGTRLGESTLELGIREADPYGLRVSLDNARPPSIGAEQLSVSAVDRNLGGRGDALRGRAALTEGLREMRVGYTLPVGAGGAAFGVELTLTESDVVEEPFNELDIESRSKVLAVSFRQPLVRQPGREVASGLTLERKSSETFLLGNRFSFSEGVNDGRSDVTALRWAQDWLTRTRGRVISMHSVFSFGMNAFGATINDTGPDGRFVTWLGQFQWAERLGLGNIETVVRADLQLSRDALLPMEKFVVGGFNTVRGYRENELVNDNGLAASLELRWPILVERGDDPGLKAAAFVDHGRSWNKGARSPGAVCISSIGLGVLLDYRDLHTQLYVAEPLHSLPGQGRTSDLQDSGIHFSVSYDIR